MHYFNFKKCFLRTAEQFEKEIFVIKAIICAFAQHFKVKCDFGTWFFCAVLVAQGIHAMGFKFT